MVSPLFSPRACLRGWGRRRATLTAAKHRALLATEKAKVGLAVYRAKSEIEWDMRWANPLDKTWRDEIIIAFWSLPLLGVFVPGLRESVREGFKLLASIDPSIPSLFVYGWGIIFATTFGIKHGKSLLMPGRLAGLVEAMGKVPDAVPASAAKAAQDAVSPLKPKETVP